MAEPDPQQLLTALTTEHFGLQGARASTISEAGTRSALFLGSVSSTLVAVGFIASVAGDDELFHAFTLVVLPTLYFLGLVTWVRLVEGSVEDMFYGRAINRIRNRSALALAVSVAFDAPLGVAVAVGAVFATCSVAVMMRWDRRRHEEAAAQVDPLFPSGRDGGERVPR
jgi:hypothetical protein